MDKSDIMHNSKQLNDQKQLVQKQVNNSLSLVLNQQQQQTVVNNIPLVRHIINKKFNGNSYYDEDLLQIGTIGLIKAVSYYDPQRKTKFSTYAGRCIENEILMHFRKENKHEKLKSLEEYVSPNNEKNDLNFHDVIKSNFNCEEIVLDKFNSKIIKDIILNKLNAREKTIIINRFFKGKSQKFVANELELSQPQVSRTEKAALSKIKKFLDDKIDNLTPSTLSKKANKK